MTAAATTQTARTNDRSSNNNDHSSINQPTTKIATIRINKPTTVTSTTANDHRSNGSNSENKRTQQQGQ